MSLKKIWKLLNRVVTMDMGKNIYTDVRTGALEEKWIRIFY